MPNFPSISYATPVTSNPAPDPSRYSTSGSITFGTKKKPQTGDVSPGGLAPALTTGSQIAAPGAPTAATPAPANDFHVHMGNLLNGLSGLYKHLFGGGGQ